MVAKKSDEDAIALVTKALRHSTPELRTQLMECVVGAMIDGGDWGSIMFWQGETTNAVTEYVRMLNRTNRAVCGCCWDNLSDDLKRMLEGKITVERANENGSQRKQRNGDVR